MSSDTHTTSHKPSADNLNDQVAAQMLENIFDACDSEPNSVPLEVLVSYSNYRKEKVILQKILIVLGLLVLCAIPILFIQPDFTVTAATDSEPYAPKYTVTVNSILPVSKVSAEIDGYSVPLYETQSKIYTVVPKTNGEMTIMVTLGNHQTSEKVILVSAVDTDPPILLSNKLSQHQIVIQVQDEGSGIDYEATRAVDMDGQDVAPASYDEEKGLIFFDFPSSSLNVFIYDKAGNPLQLVLTLK